MDAPALSPIPLNLLPVGTRARIARILGGQGLSLRLMGLGLRVGAEVQILHHRGRGVVVATAGTRVALGGGMADKLLMESLPPLAPPETSQPP